MAAYKAVNDPPIDAVSAQAGIIGESDTFVVMSLLTEASARVTLRPLTATEERRRTGRYVAGGTALAVILLAIHHVLLRGAPTVAGICIPAIIMATYVLWVFYSARRDRWKARRLASAMQLTEVISVPAARSSVNADVTRSASRDDKVASKNSDKQNQKEAKKKDQRKESNK